MQALYFLRHGETEDNAASIWSRKNTQLTGKGRTQAREAGKLAKAQGVHIDAIVASPMDRAKETAQLFAEGYGYPVQTITYHDLLVERDFGKLSGTASDDFFDGTRSMRDLEGIPTVETASAVQARAAAALKLLQQHPHATVLVVGHGAFARAMQRVLNNQPVEDEFDDIQREKLRLENGVLHRFV